MAGSNQWQAVLWRVAAVSDNPTTALLVVRLTNGNVAILPRLRSFPEVLRRLLDNLVGCLGDIDSQCLVIGGLLERA